MGSIDSPHSFGSGLLSLFIYPHSFDFCFSDCFSRPKTSLFTHIFKVAFSSQYFKVPDLIQNGFYHSHPPNHPPPLPPPTQSPPSSLPPTPTKPPSTPPSTSMFAQ